MNNYIVYKHTTPSGKVYIGITSMKPEKRWKNGKGYELCTAFNRAIQKYGWSNIKHEVLLSGLSKEEACTEEQRLIRLYNSTNPQKGYNLTSGGEHYEPNDEWRSRLSESLKRSYAEHPEYREHISLVQKGRKQSPESIEKRRKTMLKFYEEHPEKKKECGNSFRGKKRSEEFSRKLGERKSKPVICVSTQKRYASLKLASENEGVCRTGITNVLIGRAKTCGGKIFVYAEDDASEKLNEEGVTTDEN